MSRAADSILHTMPSFDDAFFGAVSFTSGHDSKREAVDQGDQTHEIEVSCGATQTLKSVISETQTEPNTNTRADPEVLSGFDDWADIPPDIARFLIDAGGAIADELDRSQSSQAFIAYAPLEEGGESGISLHLTLSCDLSDLLGSKTGRGSGSSIETLQTTGVDWSSTGSVVAASFGRNDIAGWCDLPGALAVWNIFRRGFDDEMEHAPDLVLDHSSCLMCVSCHPIKPAVVAAGSFNGEVIVWDTSRDDPLLATTKIDTLFHREPVTSLSWVFSANDNDYRLAAVSGDGKLLFWTLKNNLQWPVEGYRIPGDMGRMDTRDGRRAQTTAAGGHMAGCTSVSFLTEGRHVTSAVIGTEGGAVMKCRLASSTKYGVANEWKCLHWSADAEELLCRISNRDRRQVVRDVENMVKDNRGTEANQGFGEGVDHIPRGWPFDMFLGSSVFVLSAFSSSSPFLAGLKHAVILSEPKRALLLSCGADGSAHLYNTLQARSILTFEPSNSNIMDIKWSRARPLVFVAVTRDAAAKSLAARRARLTTGPSQLQDLDDFHVLFDRRGTMPSSKQEVQGEGGGIFVYDLRQSTVIPVATSRLPPPRTPGEGQCGQGTSADTGGSNRVVGAIFSVSCNPRQRDLTATGDCLGRVLIWRMSWRLANKGPGEEEGLERLFKGSAEEEATGEED